MPKIPSRSDIISRERNRVNVSGRRPSIRPDTSSEAVSCAYFGIQDSEDRLEKKWSENQSESKLGSSGSSLMIEWWCLAKALPNMLFSPSSMEETTTEHWMQFTKSEKNFNELFLQLEGLLGPGIVKVEEVKGWVLYFPLSEEKLPLEGSGCWWNCKGDSGSCPDPEFYLSIPSTR